MAEKPAGSGAQAARAIGEGTITVQLVVPSKALAEIEVLSFERTELDEQGVEPFRRGDVNQDGVVTISDAQAIVSYLFQDGDTPACQKSSDANDNGETTVTDAVELLLYLFRGGDVLPSPFTQCGRDGTGDPLSCQTFLPCE